MAKKNPNSLSLGDYNQTQENIRKAKGNPNKHVHQKKNGSNYKGYTASQHTSKAAALQEKYEKAKQPLWVTLTMLALGAVLVAILVLLNTAFKEDLLFQQLSMLIIGVICGALVYLRRYNPDRSDTKLHKAMDILLSVMAVVYIFMGGYGFLRAL